MTNVTYSKFLAHVRAGEVQSVVITAKDHTAPVTARLRNGSELESTLPGDYREALTVMQQSQVDIGIVSGATPWPVAALPFTILLVAWMVAFVLLKRGYWVRNRA